MIKMCTNLLMLGKVSHLSPLSYSQRLILAESGHMTAKLRVRKHQKSETSTPSLVKLERPNSGPPSPGNFHKL